LARAKNGEIKIYYEVEGKGPPLVLHHGLSNSLESWRENGIVDALKKDYQLILMDARGHGKSDKPHDPEAYSQECKAGDVSAVLDDLGIQSAHFCGYSYGGRMGFEMAKLAPDRVKSVIAGGAGVAARSEDDPERVRQIQLFSAGVEGLKALIAMFEQSVPMAAKVKTRLLANDPEALLAIAKSSFRVDLEGDLPNMKMPFLVFAGESDFRFPAVQEAVRRLPNAQHLYLPGLDHMQALLSSAVLAQVREFLARVSQK
jgi:pimeloyl-ACP methyl ester carboxylesterase